jgi:hypothetical protein
MTPPRTVPNPHPTNRLDLQRRVKRGIVAGYLHGLSQRHRADDPAHEPAHPTVAARESAGPSPM